MSAAASVREAGRFDVNLLSVKLPLGQKFAVVTNEFRNSLQRREALMELECVREAPPSQIQCCELDGCVVVADATYADDEAHFLTF